jgi:Spy/CpxP family protein refolding chaperone
MKNRQKLLAIAVFAALTAAAPLSQAQSARSDEPPAATNPRGYGPGMMGGYGYGPGMMGGGFGRGSMMGPFHALDLSDQQRSKINQIQDETRRKHWDVMGKLLDEQARMRDLFTTDKRDPAAIGKQSMKIAELRRQLLEASIDAHNRMEALLTKEQRDQLRSFGRGWMMGDE